MRVSCADNEEYPGQFALWEANCTRSISGRKGQKALRALERALLLMPKKRLERDLVVEKSGEMCAIGAQLVQGKIDDGATRTEAIEACSEIDPYLVEDEARKLDTPRLVAWSIVFENDDINDPTPERRYERMLKWVQTRLKDPTEPPAVLNDNGPLQQHEGKEL